MMVTGQRLHENTIKEQIYKGLYATTFPDAFRRFGTNFVEVHPIPNSCLASNLNAGCNTIYILDDTLA